MGKQKKHQPIYRAIKDALVHEIEHSNYVPNAPFLTENEAIERFKVSRVTVRQALELLEQDGYIYRVQGKGSFIGPRDAVPAKTVAFIATCILANGIESILLRAIEDYLDRNNYNLIICNNNNSFGKTEAYIKRLIRSGIDAVIYVCVLAEAEHDRNAEMIDFVRNHEIPVILVDRYLKSMVDKVFIVTPDNYNAAYTMTQHLISLGHRSIGLCTGVETSATRDRYAGYRQCLRDHKIEFKPDLITRVRDESEYRNAALTYKSMKTPPTALFALWDDLAYQLIDVFQELGLSVPDDIAVVGFDDYTGLKPARPYQLTTMRTPLWEEGKLAASIAVDLIKRAEITPKHIKVPCELVIRETCGIKRVAQRLMALNSSGEKS